MQCFKTENAEIHYDTRGDDRGTPVIWAHGWGQSHQSFAPLATSLEKLGHHIMVDFPGFGASPVPAETWSTAEYADALADFIKGKTSTKIVWVGHSFGCRVGIQLAARHPDLVAGLFLVAAAGLPRRRPLPRKLYVKIRVLVFKLLKKCIPLGLSEEWLMKTFGSADYKNAGPMRGIFVKVVKEDLSDTAKNIQCPVMLVYGEKDSETPPEIGERLQKLIPNAEMVHLAGEDHYSILGNGRHQVASLLKTFVKDIST